MEKVQFRVLYRDFLRRLFEVELLSAHAGGDASALLGQFAALLISLSVPFIFPALGFDEKLPAPLFFIASLSAQHFLIATTMLMVGLFAVLSWNSAFPEKRDILVLAPLPVRSRTIFLAKAAAVGSALAMAVLALHVLAGFIWPFAFNTRMPAQAVPALTSERALAPVGAAQLRVVLDQDLKPILQNGGLAPGTGGGLAIGVYKRGVRRVMAYGTASANSIFEIGSLSKTFTGLLLARMVEEKKVKFDEPVRLLLPENTVEKPMGDEIRLIDLATHHSGLPGMPNNLPAGNTAHQFIDYHVPDLYAYLYSRGVERQNDVSFLYSNLGFSVLGQALANRAGLSYPELLRREITGPLGLTDTVIKLSPEQEKRLIQGHNEKHEAVQRWDLDAFAGAGGIRSTAGDMLTYLVANLHPQRTTLTSALAESHKLRAEVAPRQRIALAWFYNLDDGSYAHEGATGGYTSFALFNPHADYAVIVLLNNGPSLSSAVDLIGEHISQRLTGEPAISLANVLIPASGGFPGLLRSLAVYWITMFAAGGFTFCCVLGLQGMAAQLPRRYFLRVSSFLQLGVFCLLVCVYFLQPTLALPGSLIPAQGHGALAWSPSFWFLGLYQQLNGSPMLAPLARKAWAGLTIAACGTALAYALSYFRMLKKIVEEPDILPGAGRSRRLPRFGGAIESAIAEFAMRTLARSRQHRVILAFYLGVAFAITIFLLKSPEAQELSKGIVSDRWRGVSMPLLESTILIMIFTVVGLRVVFSLPMNLPANWIFRVTPVQAGSGCAAGYRRSLWMLAVAPVWLGSAVLLLSLWPWQAAVGHLLVLGLLGSALVEFCLQGNQKIPFACSWLPGKSKVHVILIAAIGVLPSTLKAAQLERVALQKPTQIAMICMGLGAIAAAARWRTRRLAHSETTWLRFEQAPAWEMTALNLPKDGGLRVEPEARDLLHR